MAAAGLGGGAAGFEKAFGAIDREAGGRGIGRAKGVGGQRRNIAPGAGCGRAIPVQGAGIICVSGVVPELEVEDLESEAVEFDLAVRTRCPFHEGEDALFELRVLGIELGSIRAIRFGCHGGRGHRAGDSTIHEEGKFPAPENARGGCGALVCPNVSL